MTLQKKVIYMVLSSALVLLILTMVVSGITVQRSYTRLEHQNVIENLQRITNAMENKLIALDSLAADWAFWDDTYDFVEDRNVKFVESNFTDSAFSSTDLNLIAIVDLSGNIVIAETFDLEAGVETPVSPYIYQHLADPIITSHDNLESRLSCIVQLPECPLLLVSRPILTSDAEGPIRGALIMGRYLDSGLLARLAETTLLQVSAYPINNNTIPDDVASLIPLFKDSSVLIQPQDNNRIAGYTIIDDVRGEPYLLVKLDMPRSIKAQAQEMLLVTYVGIIAIFAVFLLANVWFLEKKSACGRIRWKLYSY